MTMSSKVISAADVRYERAATHDVDHEEEDSNALRDSDDANQERTTLNAKGTELEEILDSEVEIVVRPTSIDISKSPVPAAQPPASTANIVKTVSAVVRAPSSYVVKSNDAVFFNMAAKPIEPGQRLDKKPTSAASERGVRAEPAEELPSYNEVATLAPPDYTETVYLANELSDVLFEGINVGSYSSFVASCFLACCFQFVGFMLSFVLAQSYAGKYGAIAGLGLTIAFLSQSLDAEAADSRVRNPSGRHSPSGGINANEPSSWLTLIIIGLGYLTFFYSLYAYHRVRQTAKQFVVTSVVTSTAV